MKTALWIALSILVVLAAATLAGYLVGARLPREHRASRSALLRRSPAEVYRVISDVTRYPAWRKDVRAVTPLADQRYREDGGFGPIVYRLEADEPPSRRVTRIDDATQPFGGTWTFELAPEANGTRLTITEDGFVDPPLFRFLSRFVFGQTKTIDTYLRELEAEFERGAAAGQNPSS
jgi:hypothetical protein